MAGLASQILAYMSSQALDLRYRLRDQLGVDFSENSIDLHIPVVTFWRMAVPPQRYGYRWRRPRTAASTENVTPGWAV